MTTENPAAAEAAKESEAKATRSRKKAEEETALTLQQTAYLGLPNNRPIDPSHLNIVHSYKSVGGLRPVTAGEMEISSIIRVSGDRPIAVSHLKVSDTIVIMGNRPVASNDIDDSFALMGYLD